MRFEINPENKKKQFKILIQRAKENLRGAKILLREKDFRGAVSRAYYGIFEAGRAALITKGIATKTHSGLVSQFSLNFIKSKKIPQKFGDFLKEAKEFREAADYGMEIKLAGEDAERIVNNAEEFVKVIEKKI